MSPGLPWQQKGLSEIPLEISKQEYSRQYEEILHYMEQFIHKTYVQLRQKLGGQIYTKYKFDSGNRVQNDVLWGP